MAVSIDIHFVLGFLVALCVLVFSWNDLGRRVVNVVLGLQVLAGLAVAATHLAAHEPLGHTLVIHIAGAIVALGFYGMASRASKRPGGGRVALVLSVLGLLTVGATIYYGMEMYFRHMR